MSPARGGKGQPPLQLGSGEGSRVLTRLDSGVDPIIFECDRPLAVEGVSADAQKL